MKREYTRTILVSAIVFCLFLSINLNAQIEFTNQNSLINNTNHSGVAIVVADMNNDKLDDIVRLSQGRYLIFEYQNPGGNFITDSITQVANQSQWAMCVGDVDNNGYNDVMCGDYNNSRLIKADNTGSEYTMSTIPGSNFFAQGSNFADINNDGLIDAFVCNDDGESGVFGNDGNGGLMDSGDWIDMSVNGSSGESASGNYGSVWTDFDNDGDLDLYIAKCRQGVGDPSDSRRINTLWVNDGNNNYTESAETYGLKIGWQSWTADFQDIDNDGDLDVFVTNHDFASQLLENDGNGFYKDISNNSGVDITGFLIQGVMRDFDNDGFVDVLIAGGGGVHSLYLNNRDKTFTKVENLFDSNNMKSYAIGDLNHDGFLDIYASYANNYTDPSNIDDVLWMNEGNDNNFFTADLIGNSSNRNAIGARVEIYGEWGVQIREVRAGESYGIGNSMALHYGLGEATEISHIVVKWPSGNLDVIFNPAINQFLTIEEGDCEAIQVAIEPDGSTIFCSGESVELMAPVGYSYYWSNGETSQNITVTEAGIYNVIVQDNDDCFGVSQAISVTVDPEEIPELEISGDLEFCVGDFIVLTSSEASSYDWSNGETTQSITVSETGNYFVTTQGLCDQFESESIMVNILPAPAPTAENVNIPSPGPAMLIAVGDNPQWWDAPSGGNSFPEGDTLFLNNVDVTTSYWVEDLVGYMAPEENVGMATHEGNNEYNGDNFNGGIIFNCISPFTVNSVLVFTDTEGERLIELRDNSGAVVNSILVNVPVADIDGIRIDLNFDVQPGLDYELTTNEDQNNTTLGYVSPRLKRSNGGANYSEYFVENIVELTNSIGGGNSRYYYFYDWEIQAEGLSCLSDRVEAQVVVGPVSTFNIDDSNEVQLYPNPSNGNVNLMMDFAANDVSLKLTDLSGKTVHFQTIGQVAKKDVKELNLSNLAKGVYFIQILANDNIYNGKVVLQ